MSVLTKKWFVIINPTSGNGKSKKKWPEIKALLNSFGFNYDFALTEYPKHGSLLAQKAVENGILDIICIGGDGTLHNIINGIMAQKKVPSNIVNIGMIPIGTGNDWVKTHHIPINIKDSIKTLLKGTVSCQDIGMITFIDQDLEPIYFNNLAGVGFDGYVANKVHKYKYLGTFSYLFGALVGLFSFKNFNAIISVNHKTFSGKTLMVLVGIGKYSGGGMQLTKSPDPTDGMFDVSIAKNFSKLAIIRNLGGLFNGNITNHANVVSLKTNDIQFTFQETIWPYIQADGEVIGTGNIIMRLIPKAFSFYS